MRFLSAHVCLFSGSLVGCTLLKNGGSSANTGKLVERTVLKYPIWQLLLYHEPGPPFTVGPPVRGIGKRLVSSLSVSLFMTMGTMTPQTQRCDRYLMPAAEYAIYWLPHDAVPRYRCFTTEQDDSALGLKGYTV